MMRRRSNPECQTRLHVVNSELPIFKTHGSEKCKATKQDNGSMKLFWNITSTILVFFLGYVAGHIDDKKDNVNYVGILKRGHEDYAEHEDIDHERNIIDVDDDDDDGFHKPVTNRNEYTMVQDSSPFAVPELEEFQMSPLYWSSDGKQVDDDARLVGLPPRLTHEILEFCEEIGLFDMFEWAAHNSNLDIHDTMTTGPDDLEAGHNWAITRPLGDHKGSTNEHWLDAIDEMSFEATVDVLKRGLFDDLLDVFAAEFEPWGYMFAGMGFMVASHSEASLIHQTNPEGGKHLLKLIFPIHLPEHNVAQIYVGNEDEKKVAPLNLNWHQGLLVGANTTHGMGDFDYRKDGSFRVFASIYIADVHDNNVDIVSEYHNALFPIPTDWLASQQGRFWGGTYGGSFSSDRGRKPFVPKDDFENCPELAERGLCLRSSGSNDDPRLWTVRVGCPKSCGIFIDDETYFSEVRPPPKERQHALQHTEEA